VGPRCFHPSFYLTYVEGWTNFPANLVQPFLSRPRPVLPGRASPRPTFCWIQSCLVFCVRLQQRSCSRGLPPRLLSRVSLSILAPRARRESGESRRGRRRRRDKPQALKQGEGRRGGGITDKASSRRPGGNECMNACVRVHACVHAAPPAAIQPNSKSEREEGAREREKSSANALRPSLLHCEQV